MVDVGKTNLVKKKMINKQDMGGMGLRIVITIGSILFLLFGMR